MQVWQLGGSLYWKRLLSFESDIQVKLFSEREVGAVEGQAPWVCGFRPGVHDGRFSYHQLRQLSRLMIKKNAAQRGPRFELMLVSLTSSRPSERQSLFRKDYSAAAVQRAPCAGWLTTCLAIILYPHFLA